MSEFHPEITNAATEIADDLYGDSSGEPKAEIVISTAILVVCAIIQVALACYRWRTEGCKTATPEEVAAKLQDDMNKLPNYDPATDTFSPSLIRRMAKIAKREGRKQGEHYSNDAAEKLAIAALRKAQRGVSASCMTALPPDDGEPLE